MALVKTHSLKLALLAVFVARHVALPQENSDIPKTFTPPVTGYDYVRREVMIPMRDGVKLYTVILVPKGAANAPIPLTRTPYSGNQLTSHAASSHLGQIL